jgi:hypothetical protein
MIRPAPSEWTGSLEAITMKSIAKLIPSLSMRGSRAWNLGGPREARHLHNRRHAEDHMVAAVYQDGEWLILDNLANLLVRDWEKTDYEPLAVLDYRGARRYLFAFWIQ